MATRFYFAAVTTPDISPAFAVQWVRNTEGARRVMSSTKDGSAMASATIWANGAAAAQDTALSRQFISAPMVAGVAFATTDTIKVQVRCMESAADDNIDRVNINLRVIAADGSTVQASLRIIQGTLAEWNTALRNKTLSTLVNNAYTTVAGDRLVMEIGGKVSSAGGSTVTGTMSWGSDSGTDLPEDETTTAANNPWFEISRDISFIFPLTAAPMRV